MNVSFTHKNHEIMHNRPQDVQFQVSFLPKSLRNSKKMCYFAPRKRKKPHFFQDSKFIINILK